MSPMKINVLNDDSSSNKILDELKITWTIKNTEEKVSQTI